jgi:hypothetical protein
MAICRCLGGKRGSLLILGQHQRLAALYCRVNTDFHVFSVSLCLCGEFHRAHIFSRRKRNEGMLRMIRPTMRQRAGT